MKIISAGPGSGKCVDGTTIVLYNCGMKRINRIVNPNQKVEDLSIKDGNSVISLDETNSTFNKESVISLHRDKVKHGFKVITQHGYSVTGSPWHPLYTSNSENLTEFTSIEDIQKGISNGIDYWVPIVTSDKYINSDKYKEIDIELFEWNGSKHISLSSKTIKLDNEISYIMGLLIGDGGLTELTDTGISRNTFRFSSNDMELVNKIEVCINKLDPNLSLIKSIPGSDCDWRVTSPTISAAIRLLGMNKRSEYKYIPDLIIESPLNVINSFIKGLFDTDGSALNTGYVEYCTASEQLSIDVHSILLLQNIRSTRRFKPNDKLGSWNIEISHNADIYYNKIGFGLNRKQQRHKLLPLTRNSNWQIYPPAIHPILKDIYLTRKDRNVIDIEHPTKAYGPGQYAGHRWKRYYNGTRVPSLQKMQQALDELNIPDNSEIHKYYLQGEVIWEKLKTIKPQNVDLYDLTCRTNHSFIGNGFINHNTTSALELARGVIKENLKVQYISITNTSIDDAKMRFESLYGKEVTPEEMERFNVATMHSYALEIIRSENKHVEIIPTTEFEAVPFNVIREPERSQEFIDLIRDRITAVTEKGKEKKTLVIPLGWVIHFIVAFRIQPPANDVLIIDEFQDMDSDEIGVLAELFGDNAYLFGDINQCIYQFRFPDNNETVYIDDSPLVPSYRFDQITCDFLNRMVLLKSYLLPKGTTANTKLYSDINNNIDNSIELMPFGEATTKTSLFNKFEGGIRKLPVEFEAMIEQHKDGKTFSVLSFNNYVACEYTELIQKKYGNVLQTWYMKIGFHPIYAMLRDALSGLPVTDLATPKRIASIVSKTLLKRGYSINPTSVGKMFDKTAADRTRKDQKKYFHTGVLYKALDELEKGNLDPNIVASRRASKKSNMTAALSVLSSLAKSGLKSSFFGIRLQSESDLPGRVLTVHSSKGTEADYVLLDIAQQSRPFYSYLDYIQYLNTLYVACSRHKKKLLITSTDSATNLQQMGMAALTNQHNPVDSIVTALEFSKFYNKDMIHKDQIQRTDGTFRRIQEEPLKLGMDLITVCSNKEIFDDYILPRLDK